MERPALQKLLNDVRARKIDVIVVYKVDRLTRSLADFAKLVDLFDAHGVSFISVTQAFNTTTSMGRLTLNMLLSFARFEREITGERIRDKVAASKRKGIWMGGAVPLGYRVEDRALRVVEREAEFVRALYRRYLELGSVVRLKTALDSENVRCPSRMSRSGRTTGGVLISRGHLYWILSNPIYVGRLRHKGQIHDGLHSAIVDGEIWEQVQQRLASQTQTRRASQRDDHSFLVGKLYDDRGNRMGASHASKDGRRWRYYVSRAALSGRWKEAGSVVRIPAPEIENQVANAVGAHLAARANAIDGCHIDRGDGRGDYAITQHESARVGRYPPSENDVRNAIDRATVSATRIEIVLNESIVVERWGCESRFRFEPNLVEVPLFRVKKLPSCSPGNGILQAETGGRIQAQSTGDRPEFGSQTGPGPLTYQNCEGFYRSGNRAMQGSNCWPLRDSVGVHLHGVPEPAPA